MDAILCERLMRVSGLDCVRRVTSSVKACSSMYGTAEEQMILRCVRGRAHASEN